MIAALLFVLAGGYAASLKSGGDEPDNPQSGVFTKTPGSSKHLPGSGPISSLTGSPRSLPPHVPAPDALVAKA
ncbi:hypothetical protein GCM10009087_27260 [Sphingomonas oligophenolica]|uniref:Uncharacterized protein n=1 Tax=Sphingomonas oligophenolica TaxID=301154 RepID=A0ABU9Y4B7_9SPHN